MQHGAILEAPLGYNSNKRHGLETGRTLDCRNGNKRHQDGLKLAFVAGIDRGRGLGARGKREGDFHPGQVETGTVTEKTANAVVKYQQQHNMASSSIHKTTGFEIQIKHIHSLS